MISEREQGTWRVNKERWTVILILPFTDYRSPFTIRRSRFTIRYSPFATHRMPRITVH